MKTHSMFKRLSIIAILLLSINWFPVTRAAEKVDGTTGIPMGGIGAGAVKFCANTGNFASAPSTPVQRKNFPVMNNTCLQFYSNRGGTIVTSNKLSSVLTSEHYDDDAFFPVEYANLGTFNNVSINLTAFSPIDYSNLDNMSCPYAFFEIQVSNNETTPVNVACAFQIGTSIAPTGTSGKGIQTTGTNGGVEYAVYGSSGDTTAVISFGNDNGFFTTGQCNSATSGTVNKTAVLVSLAANETKSIRFVLAWYNGVDTLLTATITPI